LRKRHLLITALPGTGKTTLLLKLARRMAEFHPTGFYTEEIREAGERQGFRLVSLDGRQGILAHVDFYGKNRVGRYGVDVRGFERFLEDLGLEETSASIVFIDEIGKMECLSPHFVELMRKLLGSRKTVVATVAFKGSGFISVVKGRPDCETREMTIANRDKLEEELARWISDRQGEAEG
jgi:nucleoside-triphosphatase